MKPREPNEMTFTPEQNTALAAKLERDAIKQRSQAGRTFSYVEGWHAISEANRIFGFDGWSRETVFLSPTSEPYQNANSNWCIGYRCMVRISAGGIIREGCGFGSGIDKDVGRAHESALKEAETDAMKRALMTFGNPFGLALYDKDQEGVEAPVPARGPYARPEPSPPQREAGKPADPKITSGALPMADGGKAAGDLIIRLNACKTENDLMDMKADDAFLIVYRSLPPDQRARVDDMGRKVAARFPANPIAGG